MSSAVRKVPGGFVRLDGALADDLSVVNSARVSFGRSSEELSDSDVGLIVFLMRNRHGTPFEHNAFRFHVRCPIFVAREWFRHRIGSFNEYSQRYTRAIEEAYAPYAEDMRKQVGKPGAYTFEPMVPIEAVAARIKMQNHYDDSFKLYNELLQEGLAKEIARCVLPVATITEFYWTVNARSLMNFLSLRNSPQALLEIRRYAEVVEELFVEQMPVTAQAFIDNGRVAP